MFKKVFGIIGLVAGLAVIIILAGCSSAANAQEGTYKETEITPTVTGDIVSIPISVVDSKHNIHFVLATTKGNTSFEAYTFNGAIQVRASFCVPCRGTSFTLSGDKLICDTCGTVFSAKDGTGVSGVAACKSYPKAAVAFTTTGGNIVMQSADLQTAFNNTLSPGLP
jgi:hypothetical protein